MPRTEDGYKLADGTPVPGVTSILGDNLGWGKEGLLVWANKLGRESKDHKEERQRAGRIGTLAHRLIQDRIEGTDTPPEWPDLLPEAAPCLEGFGRWQAHKPIEHDSVELALVSERYRFGGTLDSYGALAGENGARWVIDFKTSGRIHESHVIQLCAYGILLEEAGRPVDRFGILHLPAGTSRATLYKVKPEAAAVGKMAFLSLLALHEMKPRLLVSVACDKEKAP